MPVVVYIMMVIYTSLNRAHLGQGREKLKIPAAVLKYKCMAAYKCHILLN